MNNTANPTTRAPPKGADPTSATTQPKSPGLSTALPPTPCLFNPYQALYLRTSPGCST